MTPRWFDREEILGLLRRRVTGFLAGYRKNLALLGPEGSGKTVLLQRLLQGRLPPGSFLIPVYAEVREGDAVPEWASRFTRSLCYSILQARKVSPLPRDLPDLIRACGRSAPRTASAAVRVLRLADQGKSDEAYDLLWDLPSLAAQEAGCPALLVLDEFHRLRGLPVRDPFRPLGRRVMVQASSLFVVASSQPQAARAILREGLALLFGQFETLELGPLSPLACLSAVRAAWPAVQEDPLLEEILLELAQGHAGTLDLLLRGLAGQAARQHRDTPQSVLLGLLQSLFLDPGSELRGRFESRLRSLPSHHTRPFCIQVLSAVADGKHRLAQIAEQTDRSPAQAARALRVLEQCSLVVRQGAFHRVGDRLFELWLRMGYPLLHGVGLADAAEAGAHFQQMAQGWLAQVRGAAGQPAEERVVELMRQWKGEVVEVDGRRMLLPAFHRIELGTGLAGRPRIAAHRPGQDAAGWRVLVWTSALTEAGARELAEQWRGSDRDARRIAVGPYPVDLNARLILQQARIRLWDLQTLNGLLELYGLRPLPVPRDFDPGLTQEWVVPPEQAPAGDLFGHATGGLSPADSSGVAG